MLFIKNNLKDRINSSQPHPYRHPTVLKSHHNKFWQEQNLQFLD